MFYKALVATDIGESSEQLVRCTGGLRNLGVREVVLGFCIRLHEVRGVRANVEDILRPDLDRRREALERQGYAVKAELLLGDPHVEVNRLADAKACDMVVVGSRVHSLAGEVLLSGVAGEILHHCRWPLLVLRLSSDEKCPDACPLMTLDRVLFATDFSENAEHAFASMKEFASGGLKSTVLLHVQDRSKIDRHLKDRLEEFNAVDRGRLERMKDTLAGQGVKDVEIELPYGLPTDEILRRTRRGDVSLVIMGSQGRGFVGEVLLGSVSHNIARHAPVPVLLIPALR